MKKKQNLSKMDEYTSIRQDVLDKLPAAREAWFKAEPKRRLALMLARIRKQAGLTQRELASRAGWDKSFVSRLESATGGIADYVTISRFAEACGAQAGVVVGNAISDHQVHVIDAVTIAPEPARKVQQKDKESPKSGDTNAPLLVFENLREKEVNF